MPSSTMLIELANISTETIQHISNFISTDKDSGQMMDKRKLLDGPPDTEDRVYLDNPELSDDMSSGDLTDTVEHLQRHWLRQTLIASGPNFETLVIAFAQKFVILERSKSVSSMEIAAKIRATEEEHAYISALYVFGVAPEISNASSKPLSADWICICIGLSNGNLLFYTEHGVLLFSEKCASTSLLAIRLGPSVHPGNQELVVMTDESKLIVIEGLSLCVTLRTARRNIAHGEKSAEELSEILQLNSQQLQINKLRRINDVLLAGLSRFATFDQYFNAFYAGGRKESISPIQLPIHSQYICTIGSKGGTKNNGEQNLLLEKDFVAFFFHSFQSNSSTLTDALYSITSKISNNIPSFGFRSYFKMGVSRKDRPQKQWLNDAQTTNIYMKSSLRDGKRLAERAFLAPYGWHFVAITDNIGRVLLIHTKLKRIVRMWKGYRQARCAWLEVESSSSVDSKQMPTKTLFLVIFAPKRGLLEVWSMENGPRVSAFEVPDGGRLLSIPSTQSGILHESSDINQIFFPNLVVFISPNGLFFSINVPFHLSALDSSTAFVHDECILKKFKSEIGKISANDQLFQFYQKMKTDDGRRNFLDLLLKFENIPIEKLNELLTKLLETKETEKHHFRQYILNLEKAIRCYSKLNELFKAAKNEMHSSGLRDNLNLEFLDLENSDSNIFSALESLEMLRKCERDSKPMVDFALHRLNLHEFAANLNFPQQNQEGMKLWRFGATLFAPVFLKPEMAAAVKEILIEINFDKEKLAEIYHTFWLDNELNMNLEEYANQSYEILKLIFLDNISNMNADEMAQIMGATKKIEKAIFESTNTKGAMLLAFQMNALQRQLLAIMNQKESNSKDNEKFVLFDDTYLEWQASIENADANFWTLSALNLGALSLLRFVISAKGDISKANLMNLAKMAQKGVGFYREQIGILVSYAAMEPDELIKLFCDENEGQKGNEENAIFVCLKMLFRKIFPLNLRLELVICDIIWENASLWNKNGHRAIRNLELSIEFLDKLGSVPKIQHGLAEMIWDTFASKRFEHLFLLLEEQFGQRQSDTAAKNLHFLAGQDWRLKKDVNVSESNLNIYIFCVRRLLEIMAESSRHIGGRQEINYGPLAGNIYQQDQSLNAFLAHKKTNNLLHSSGERGMMTLLQIADRQKLTNYHLVVHHYHLAAVIEIQIQLPLKSYTKPSALFDTTSGRRAFFNSLTTHPLLLMARVDDRTKVRRQNFVERCTESLEENISNYEEEKVAKIRRLIDSLVNEWQLDAANLRIKEIVKLYLYAQDEEAEERSKMLVGNRRKLSLELIPIIAARIKILLDKENGLLERIYQTSAASESTLTLINGTRNEHSPNTIDVDVTKTRKLINMAKSWLLAKERPRQHSISEIGQIDFSKCQQLLKEFDEISIVSQKMEADR